MSVGVVPDIKTITFGNCPIEDCEIGADDIDWCTGFWNEMDGEMTPSLYPDSPIFSSNEYDWDDPVFLENVFITPDVKETFAGTRLNGHPAFTENPFAENEDIYSISNSYEPDSILQVGPPSNASSQKSKRTRKPAKTENAQDTPSKRQKTSSTKKTKPAKPKKYTK